MDFSQTIQDTFYSLMFLAIVFIPMEKAFPAWKGQGIFRRNWFTDLCFYLGQYLLWSSLLIWTLSRFGFWLDDILPTTFRAMVQSQPTWLQITEVVILSDFIIYWGHRFQHNNEFLWKFHKVHHSAEQLDWLASYREHPLDSVYTVGLINLPAFIIGFPLETISGFIAFRGIWAIYIHSNVRISLGPLRKLIGSPELHHWHHDLARDRGNYANISPIMDILFGTYTCPDHEPGQVGIKEHFPKNYVGQLLKPLQFWK